MQSTILKLIIIFVCSAQLIFQASCDVISSQDLVEKSKFYDGKHVEYQGEAIGDIMKRGSHAWVNISDGSYAIGIWIPEAEVKKISITGKYKSKGDSVKVSGVFNRACQEHGGDMDIHADDMTIVEKGYKTAIAIDYTRVLISAVLTLIAALLFYIAKKRKA